jgi:hypothetical protein
MEAELEVEAPAVVLQTPAPVFRYALILVQEYMLQILMIALQLFMYQTLVVHLLKYK